MARWSEVAKLDDLPPASSLEITHEGRTYALFRVGDRVVGVSGFCPHQGGHLARGAVTGSAVTCPRRGCLRWRFDLITGEGPIAGGPRLERLDVRVEGGSISVAWEGGPFLQDERAET